MQIVPFIVSGNNNDLALMVNLVNEEKVKTIIDSKYPLEKAADAWAKSMDGHTTGNIVLMKVVQYSGYGGDAGALQYVDAPISTPKKGELLIKLRATGLNPVDWKIQKGLLHPLLPSKFPFIPAVDVAGEVVSVGPGVNDLTTGDKVVSMLGSRNGGSARSPFHSIAPKLLEAPVCQC
jgi:NADPH:quinone reductase-like Zn-dependent oxidoreductase